MPFGSSVKRRRPEAGNEGAYRSRQRVGAYIPERFNSQAMVVKVLAGQFAFRTQGPGVIVDPQANTPGEVRAVTRPLTLLG